MKLGGLIKASLVLSALTAICVVAGSAQQLKIGLVNKAEILEQSEEFKDAQRKFNAQREKWDQELQQMKKELDDRANTYQRQENTMSEEAKRSAMVELEELNQRLTLFYQEIYSPPAGKMQQLENELAEPIRIKLEEIINTIGKDEGYHMIVDVGPTSDIVFSSGLVSLNSRVVQELNKQFKSKQTQD
jgi:Skp family chaperone for outer membrane proteins